MRLDLRLSARIAGVWDLPDLAAAWLITDPVDAEKAAQICCVELLGPWTSA